MCKLKVRDKEYSISSKFLVYSELSEIERRRINPSVNERNTENSASENSEKAPSKEKVERTIIILEREENHTNSLTTI